MLRFWLMTIRTVGLGVLADQREIREVMFERCVVQLHDIGVTAFMIRMTVGAILIERLGISSVVAAFIVDVRSDVLMTIETQRALFGTFESQVTGAALGFVFGMALDDVTGHHQRFDLAGGSLGQHQ